MSHLRVLVALTVLLALVGIGAPAVAQEEAAAQEVGADSSGEEAGPADETVQECARADATVVTSGAVEADDASGDEAGEIASAREDDSECVPPPRCDDGGVDLAPDEKKPKCVDRARLNRLISNFEAAAAEEAAALTELSAALELLGALNEQLESLTERLGEVQVRLVSARADAGFAAIRESIATESFVDVSAALEAEQDQLKVQAIQAYMGGDEVELAAATALLEIDGYGDLEIAREYAATVLGDQLATVDRVDALQLAVETLAGVIDRVEAAARADVERVGLIGEQVDEFIAAQSTLVAEAEEEASGIAEKISQIQQQKQVYADQLRIQGAGGGAIGESLRLGQADQEQPEFSAGLLASPLPETRIRSGFGPRIHPIFGDARLHSGVDMSGGAGAPIGAAADGVVVFAEETEGYGNVVVVDHGNTVATLYAHMSAGAVAVGQELLEGDLVGFVGSSGFSTGPHLHFEVRVSGTPVDPMLYLRIE